MNERPSIHGLLVAPVSALFASILFFSAPPPGAGAELSAPSAPGLPWTGTSLDLEARVGCQRVLEEVRWNHRLWPGENPGPKPRFTDVLSESELRRRAERTVLLSNALDRIWNRPVGDAQLRAELARIQRDTRAPDLLADFSRALGGHGYLLAECLARPTLVERLASSYLSGSAEQRGDAAGAPRALDSWLDEHGAGLGLDLVTDPTAWESWSAPPPRRHAGTALSDTWAPTAALPEGVSGFSVVWTGTEMIVWGGVWDGGKRDTGSRYDPATDSWTSIAAIGAPTPRREHTAVWTGTEMIVWGGCGQSSSFCELASGGRYDPIADSWIALPASPVDPRRAHAAVWTGSEMIVWGGCRTGSLGNNACEIELGSGGRYAPSTNSWALVSTEGEPSPRIGHEAVWTGAEMIVWGGFPGAVTNTGGRYDPVDDSWSPTSTVSAPSARSLHTMVWTGAEMIVWGGCNNILCASGNTRLGDGGRYDPIADVWSPMSLAAAPDARTDHVAVWSGSRMIVWGGRGEDFEPRNTGGRYDPLTDAWATTTTVDAPLPRAGHGAVWTGAEMIVWGQLDSLQRKSGGRYDPESDSWVPTSLNDPRRPRQNHVAVWTGAELVVWGGDIVNAGGGEGCRYDPATDTWAPISDTGQPSDREHGLAAVWTGTEMIVWGGQIGTMLEDTGGRYNPTTDSWQATSIINAPTPRAYSALIWTGLRMMVWGGNTESSPTATGGLYDPATDTWTATSLDGAPPASSYLSGVWTGSHALVWGGVGGSFADLDSGGRYDPATNTWSAISTTGAPSPRHFHTAIWTGSRLLVWGGIEGFLSGAGYLSTGGLYDPATDAWVGTALVGAPSGRIWHTSVWTGREAIIWGGCNSGSVCETGLFTGARYDPQSGIWSATPTRSAPGARNSHIGVWTGSGMLVWGGLAEGYGSFTSTGGLYTPPNDLALFLDGFESADTSAWDRAVPSL